MQQISQLITPIGCAALCLFPLFLLAFIFRGKLSIPPNPPPPPNPMTQESIDQLAWFHPGVDPKDFTPYGDHGEIQFTDWSKEE